MLAPPPGELAPPPRGNPGSATVKGDGCTSRSAFKVLKEVISGYVKLIYRMIPSSVLIAGNFRNEMTRLRCKEQIRIEAVMQWKSVQDCSVI